jgi:hypothetical protein
LVSIVLAVFPAEDEPRKALAVAKVVGMTVVMIGAGLFVYRSGRRRAARQAVPGP